jgi:tRNA wybutosine-synthesizing protein 1
MQEELKRILEKQKYKIVGQHSGVKLCHWLRQKLLYGRECYKESFYGIRTHRCLQMTPAVNQCNQNCLFCWRYQGFTETNFSQWDEPELILEDSIKAQRRLLTGYKGEERCDKKLWEEAQHPNQVAISLSGEPTLYPFLGDFIALCKKRGMTTFLVSNGTTPEVLENLDPLPTQLYISVTAPNKEIYKKLCVPMISNGWELLNQTLELIPSLDTRTVIRHTLVNKWNLGWIDEYAKLDEKTEANFIEPKGYVFVGHSRKRMNLENMPSHAHIREFGKRLSELIGYEFLAEKEDSRVMLLGRDKNIQMKIEKP